MDELAAPTYEYPFHQQQGIIIIIIIKMAKMKIMSAWKNFSTLDQKLLKRGNECFDVISGKQNF